MEQDSSNGSRAGGGATADGGERGDSSSVEQLTRSNQEEEEDDGGSAYGSGDFDEMSKAGGSESEYDSRDYGLDEDDHSSNNSPTTEDGSASYTTGTGGRIAGAEGEEDEGAEETATGGGATSTAELDARNSLSTYGDDFADDDDSVASPAGTTQQSVDARRTSSNGPSSALKTATTSSEGNNDNPAAEQQQERIERSPDQAAVAINSSSPSPSSEAGVRGSAYSVGGGGGGSNSNDSGGSARAGEEKTQDRRRSSVSEGRNKNNSHESDGGSATTIGKGSGAAALGDTGVEGGAAATIDANSSSVQKLEERLREADQENDRLREALQKGATAGAAAATAGGEDVGKELEILKSQVEAAKAMMLSNLDEDESKRERSLLELVLLAESRGYKQGEQNAAENTRTASGEAKRRTSSSTYPASATAASVKAESIVRAELEKRVESLERDLTRAGQESRAQSARAESLQRQLDSTDGGGGGGGGGGRSGSGRGRRGSGELQAALRLDGVAEGVATADIMALKVKATQLVERLRQEKAARLKAERKTQRVAGKVQVLSDHIEKLMMFLKHEATQKAKAHEQQRRLQKELELVKARSTALLRSNQAKDRVMTELREGSKILEDQLRLMDEKYMELRTKLDWTRTKADKDVRRARAQASALRTKWAILCGGGEGGESSLLDTMRVDSAPHLGHSSSAPSGGMGQQQQQQSGGGGGSRGGGTAGHNDYAAAGSHPKFGVDHQPQPQQQHHGGGGAAGPSRGGGSPPITRRGVIAPGHRGRGARGGGLVPNLSEPSFSVGRTQQQQQPGGSLKTAMPMAGYAGAGGSRGGSPQGATGLNNLGGLSAGTDPGGGLSGHAGVGRAGGSGAGHRPPWSEQGGGKGASSGRQAPQQVLYA